MERIRLDNIELRRTKNRWFEIVKWNKDKDDEYCFVIAWIVDEKGSVDVRSVGSRPWTDLTEEERNKLAKIILMFYEDLEKENKSSI